MSRYRAVDELRVDYPVVRLRRLLEVVTSGVLRMAVASAMAGHHRAEFVARPSTAMGWSIIST